MMDILHKKGVSTVILSRWTKSTLLKLHFPCHSTELGSSDHLVGLASCSKTGTKVKVRNWRAIVLVPLKAPSPDIPFAQVLIPKFPAAFVGTGDLFTALTTAWLARLLNLPILLILSVGGGHY